MTEKEIFEMECGSGLEKCYELESVSIPKNPDVGGRYSISYLPRTGKTLYILDELMGNPNLNGTYLIDPETYPEILTGSTRCFGFIVETVISANNDFTESLRIVTAANNARKPYLIVRFSDYEAYEAYQDPASVKWAELKDTPAVPVSYEDTEIPFVLANLHTYSEES